MIKGVKKGLGLASKKATAYVEDKVKEGVQDRFLFYKKKIVRIVWQQTFFIFGVLLLLIGIINAVAEKLSLKYAYILSGLIAIIISFFLKEH